MSRKTATAALLAALAALVGVLVAAPGQAAVQAAAPTRIMALGDSITGSPGCWRALLDRDLRAAGHTDIDFVGTLPGDGCGFAYDSQNEGHGGALVTTVADQNQLVGWLSATNPNVVLMHFGTNDVWSNRSTATILAAYGKLVDQMRANNATMKVLVAKIIPMAASACAECPQRVVDLNAAIPGWAAAKSTAQSPVTVVDQWTGFNTTTDTYDGVHPNSSGDRKIADKWIPAVVSALNGTTPTSTTTSTTTTTTTTSTTTTTTVPNGSCDVEIKVVNQWPGGFSAEITIRNTGAVATRGWRVGFSFRTGMALSQGWNGTFTQSGTSVTVTNSSWNGSIPPAGSTKVGFNGTGDATGWVPTPICALS
ncbi:MAG: cellulose-binding protein [Saccharothrix sp.]|nr:cellulose-binding protein [Saccharothrix sp.]